VTSTPWANVLVDCPDITDVLTYAVPPNLDVQPGDVVQVPLNSRTVGGIVVRRLAVLPETLKGIKIKPIAAVVAPKFLPAAYLELLVQVAD